MRSLIKVQLIIIIVVTLVGQSQDRAPEVRKEAIGEEVGTATTGTTLGAIAAATAKRGTGKADATIKAENTTIEALALLLAPLARHHRRAARVTAAVTIVGGGKQTDEVAEVPP